MRKRDFKVGDLVYITEMDEQWFSHGKLTFDTEHRRSVEVGTLISSPLRGGYEVKFWALPEDVFFFYNYEMIHADL